MRLFWRFAVAGAAAGSVTGTLGAGGGLVLVPLLTLLCKVESEQLFPSSLAVMLPICVVSLIPDMNTISWLSAFPYVLGGSAGGALAAWLTNRVPVGWLHKGMGIFLIWGGIRFLWQ